jgi:hypothetical protein
MIACSRVGLPASLACSLLLRGLERGREEQTEKETLLFLLAVVKVGLLRLADMLPPLADTVEVETDLGLEEASDKAGMTCSSWPGGRAVSPSRACR